MTRHEAELEVLRKRQGTPAGEWHATLEAWIVELLQQRTFEEGRDEAEAEHENDWDDGYKKGYADASSRKGPGVSAPLPLPLQIRQARVAVGLSQGALERALGWSGQGVISRYERGERVPSVEALGRIALVLGTVFVIAPLDVPSTSE